MRKKRLRNQIIAVILLIAMLIPLGLSATINEEIKYKMAGSSDKYEEEVMTRAKLKTLPGIERKEVTPVAQTDFIVAEEVYDEEEETIEETEKNTELEEIFEDEGKTLDDVFNESSNGEYYNYDDEDESIYSHGTNGKGTYTFTEDEEEMLERIALGEAGGQGVKGMALVMRTVLNRVESSKFPNNIHDVIFARRQFDAATLHGKNSRYFRVRPNNSSKQALQMVENGWDESHGALYFEGCRIPPRWFRQDLLLLFQYRDHRFYRYKD